MGVLLAPAKIAIKPIPANNAVGIGKNALSVLPNVAPIKNKGVTSPPLNPALIVKVVKSSFIIKMSNFPKLKVIFN